ncbi:MAG: molecular chaperone TorD family protein, partial [Acidobacteriota bacterium]|nr:molecular chaperone TorD family protein [Acidobacteriota bacterium]
MIKTTVDPTRLLVLADLLFLQARALSPPGAGEGSVAAVSDHELDDLVTRSGIDRESANELIGLLSAVRACAPESWSSEYARLFDGAQACPPNETAYVRRDKGVILADIAAFYRAFGFDVAKGSSEKADHIVAELQFVALLHVKLARALAADEDEHAETTRRALEAFVTDHLGCWIDAFRARLTEVAELDLYTWISHTLDVT